MQSYLEAWEYKQCENLILANFDFIFHHSLYFHKMLQIQWVHFNKGYMGLILFYANNKGADQPVHAHSLISTFVIPSL